MEFHDMIGIGGVAVYLLAYWLLQIRVLTLDTCYYSLMNLVGSSMMLCSLYYTWNLSAVISSLSWALVSGVGIIKVLTAKRKKKTEEKHEKPLLNVVVPDGAEP